MVKSGPQSGRWTTEECKRFLMAFEKHRNNWLAVAGDVRTRSAIQCRSHAQKLFGKQPLVLEPCVFPESPHWTEGSGPSRACSQSSQYGEAVHLASALEEEDWEELKEAKRLTLPCSPYNLQSALQSKYSIANSAETSLRTLSPREVRTVGVQYVKMSPKIYLQADWRVLTQSTKHGSSMLDKSLPLCCGVA